MNDIIYILDLAERHTIFGQNAVAWAFFFVFFAGLLQCVQWLSALIGYFVWLYQRGIDDIVWRRKLRRKFLGRIN